MTPVTDLAQINENLRTLEHYLLHGTSGEQAEARQFIQRGTCLLAYHDGTRLRFAPSRFIGYQSNTLEKHSSSARHGGVTNQAITRVLNRQQPSANDELELQYQQYCHSLGITPRLKGSFGVGRKYWTL